MVKKLCLFLKTSKNKHSISKYILDIKKMIGSLVVGGVPVSWIEHVDAILDGLSKDYDGFITSIFSHIDHYSVDELEALMLAQEERFKKHRLAQSSILHVNTISTIWAFNNPVKWTHKSSYNNFRGGCFSNHSVFFPPHNRFARSRTNFRPPSNQFSP